MNLEYDIHPSILVLIVETNPSVWNLRNQFLVEPDELIGQLALFCQSYSLTHRSNQLVVIASKSKESVVIYPTTVSVSSSLSSTTTPTTTAEQPDKKVPVNHTLQSTIASGLCSCIAEPPKSESTNTVNDSTIAQALSMALCCEY